MVDDEQVMDFKKICCRLYADSPYVDNSSKA